MISRYGANVLNSELLGIHQRKLVVNAKIDKDLSIESYARHIGTAVLNISSGGKWSIGTTGQKVSDYAFVKYGSNLTIDDDTYEFTALTAEINGTVGFKLILQSNDDETKFLEVDTDLQGLVTGYRDLSEAELFAAESNMGLDLNKSGGLGSSPTAIQSGGVNVFADGSGIFNFKLGDAAPTALKYAGQAVSQKLLRDVSMEIESVVVSGSGFKLFIRDKASDIYELTLDAAGVLNPASFTKLSTVAIQAAEVTAGKDLNGKGDTPLATGWTIAIKTDAVRSVVESLTGQGSKMDHAGVLKIVNAALGSLKGAASIGSDVFGDLVAISSRSLSLFSSKNLGGNETGYLQYVFDKLVNGSTANSFYTGGATKAAPLGNLSATSSVDVLQNLANKWILGLDLPNPNTQGDTANPNAAAASGVYQLFSAPLIAGSTAAFDVNQGSAGTCYLLAAIATVAQVNPSSFNSLFVSNGANSGGTQTWGVRFFDTTGTAHWVTANNQLCVRSSGDEQAAYTKVKGLDASGQSVVELWAPLVEKAYAQANELGILDRQSSVNAYFAIEGGWAEPITQIGAGKVIQYGAEAYNVNNKPQLPIVVVPEGTTAIAEYTKALNNQKPFFIVSFAVTKDASGNSEFVKGHAYMAIDADLNSTTNTTVKVYNPWGAKDGPDFVSPFNADLVTLVGVEGISFWVGA